MGVRFQSVRDRVIHVGGGFAEMRHFSAGPGGAAMPGLLNNLIAYWPGNEANGNLLDAHINGYDLIDFGTVTSNPGIVYATARQFISTNNEYFSAFKFSVSDLDWTFAAWANLDSKPTIAALYRHLSGDEPGVSYIATSDRFRFKIGLIGTVNADALGSPSTGTWYLVVAWHDSVANTVNIQVNNGAVNSAATSGPMASTNTQIQIGTNGGGTYFNGRIGPIMFWRSAAGGGGVLSAAQRTALYNGGAGLTYAAFTA